MKRIAPEWAEILTACGVRPRTASIWSEVFAVCIGDSDETFSAGERDLRAFLPQILHESGRLEHLEENLNYSADGLARTWPGRYAERGADGRPIKPYQPNWLARALERKPEAIANNCYANRMGNGPEASGDGWRYRGSCLIMCTGLDNFKFVERVTGLRVVANPQLLREPLPAMQASIRLWEHLVPDQVLGDPEREREAVNGGHIGLKETIALAEIVNGVLA